MSEIHEQQVDFLRKISVLILVAHEMGYEVTCGDFYATTGHKINSYHYSRRAADLNLFKDGNYLTETEDHRPLGELWEKMGGTWGGRFQDGNHYSLGE